MKRLVIGGIVVVLAAGFGALASRKVWVGEKAERAKAAAAEREMQASEAKRAALAAQEARLETEQGQEEQARERGFVKKGETPLAP